LDSLLLLEITGLAVFRRPQKVGGGSTPSRGTIIHDNPHEPSITRKRTIERILSEFKQAVPKTEHLCREKAFYPSWSSLSINVLAAPSVWPWECKQRQNH